MRIYIFIKMTYDDYNKIVEKKNSIISSLLYKLKKQF